MPKKKIKKRRKKSQVMMIAHEQVLPVAPAEKEIEVRPESELAKKEDLSFHKAEEEPKEVSHDVSSFMYQEVQLKPHIYLAMAITILAIGIYFIWAFLSSAY